MSTKSIFRHVALPDAETIGRRLSSVTWDDETRLKLIPLIEGLGGRVLSAEGLCQAILDCILRSGVSIGTNDVKIMLTLLCDDMGKQFVAATFVPVEELARIAQQPPLFSPDKLS